ncbi:MAG: CHAP domain-containing protein [Ruminococcus sp.]|nr:CHAP domain-containing protein [Ruminococcus sp.]
MICVIGLVAGSCFGIFFSGDDTGSGMSMRTAISEINTEYQQKIEKIKSDNPHDVLETTGRKAVWKDVLAVYAVRTASDPNNPRKVAYMDDTRLKILKDIFWEMNDISYKTDTKKETVIKEKDDGKGNIIEIKVTEKRTYLYITVTHKTVDEMCIKYGFNAEQKEQLTELLSEDNAKLWSGVLYDYRVGGDDIVAVALSQVGNIGGEPYWSWYGFGSRVEWCACFVSWCANECGYIEDGIFPKFAGCGHGVQWFKERSQWQDNTYIPKPGDIIFFDWAYDGLTGTADHVGIVEKARGNTVYTVEGNSSDACRQNSYPMGYYEILGYGELFA